MLSPDHIPWDAMLDGWREQTAAQFGRRAFAQLGRGFVMLATKDNRFIYVTRLISAPVQLVDEIYQYSPNEEAVLVYEDRVEPGVLIVRRIRIERCQ